MKKILSIMMAAVMLFSALPVNSVADYNHLTYSAAEVNSIEETWINHGYVLKKNFRHNTHSLVRPLQTMLNDLGYNLSIDGIYGSQTESAIKKFQKNHNLSADGIFGKKTRIALLNRYRTEMKQTISNVTSSEQSINISHMKSYNSSFWVIDSFNENYLFSQTDYTCFPGVQSGKLYSGCTAVSVCSMLSMSNGYLLDPEEYAKKGWTSGGCNWYGCDMISLSTSSTKARLKDLVENYTLKGTPVSFWANKYHMVLVLGVKKNADIDNLKSSDILIMDPWEAQMTTLDKAQRGGYTLTKFKAYTAK